VGRRATGTQAASYWIVPPGWPEGLPDDAKVIRSPTTVATIVGRWAVDGPDDVPTVHALQDALRLTVADDAPPPRGVPGADPSVGAALLFSERRRAWPRASPPSAAEQEALRRHEPLGLLEASSPYADPDPALAAALRDGAVAGRERLEAAIADHTA